MEIELLGGLPSLDHFDTLIFTSGNGVRSALASASLAARSVLTVGETTAELARASGADAKALGEDIESFLANAGHIGGRVLYCRGVHSRGELAQRLREAGADIEEAILYDQVSKRPSTAAQRLLSGSAPVVAPVFSPRTARLLSGFAPITAPFTVIAMSPAVAKAWNGPGDVRVSPEPTSAAMCELTLKAF